MSKLGKGKKEKEKVIVRKKWIEQKINVELSAISHSSLDPEKVACRNCENMIGVVQLPLGIAGPIKIIGNKSKEKDVFIPLATTEGALVASVSRGCKALFLSGGARVRVEKVGISRAPVFKVKDLSQAEKLINWTKENFEILKWETEKTDKYLKLLSVQSFLSGRSVFLRFVYDTSEAMGMNMATIATQEVAKLIKEQLDIDCLSLSGNMCVDKKPNWLNFIMGRGNKVWAEIKIKKDIVEKVLKTTPEKIRDVVLGKNMLGSQMCGSLGFNAHFANIVAAIFIATGQDPAHIVEGSMGITSAEIEENGDLYFSVYLPSLIVGTIGGGTGLATQKDALKILGLGNGTKNESMCFAEIVGGAVLAGELSLLAALAENHLARAHEKLGRGKKK